MKPERSFVRIGRWVDFKGAYRLFREPTFLFNIAQCERQMGDYAAAASQYRAYRREAANAPNRAARR